MMKKGLFAVALTTAFLFLSILFVTPSFAQDDTVVEESQPTEETITIDEILEQELPNEIYDEMFSDENVEKDFDLYFEGEKYFEDKYYDEEGDYYDDYYWDDHYYEIDEPLPNHTRGPLMEFIGSMGIIMISMMIWFGALICFGIPFYIYYSLSSYTIGKKLGVDGGWMAWVPILNLYYHVKMSGLEIWWLLLYFVPFVNIFAQLYVWMKIAGRRGFEEWIGLLMIVPFVNFFIPGYLAWGTPHGTESNKQDAKPAAKKGSTKKVKKKDAKKLK